MGFPFSSGDVLTAADLNSIGEFISFTPSFTTGVTVGNGTFVADYALVGEKMCMFRIRFTLGSTSAITGAVRIAYPFTVDDTWIAGIGLCEFEDTSGPEYFGRIYRYSGTEFNVTYDSVSSSKLVPGYLSSSQPFSWSTDDKIVVKALVKLQ
tara:strand:- start:471 stop:926 length:456 start_codon:yes stop_codon:yes gene_type:complete